MPTPIPARTPYSPAQIGDQFNAQTARIELAKIARAMSPMQTRTEVVSTLVRATDDTLLINTDAGNRTVILVPAHQLQWLRVQIKNVGANIANVVGTIDDVVATTIALAPYDAVVLQSDGVDWWILSLYRA